MEYWKQHQRTNITCFTTRALKSVDNGVCYFIVDEKGNTMKKNQIVKKYVLPRLFVIGGIGVVMTTAACGVVALTMKHNNQNTKKALLTIPLVGIGFVTAIVIWNALSDKKYATEYTSNTFGKYIGNLMSENTEFQDFNEVLSNPQAMKYIATVISNSLRKSEQKRILEIMARAEQYIDPLSAEEAYKQIEQVIREHIQLHPEFLPSLYREMAYANHTYIWRAKNWNTKQK